MALCNLYPNNSSPLSKLNHGLVNWPKVMGSPNTRGWLLYGSVFSGNSATPTHVVAAPRGCPSPWLPHAPKSYLQCRNERRGILQEVHLHLLRRRRYFCDRRRFGQVTLDHWRKEGINSKKKRFCEATAKDFPPPPPRGCCRSSCSSRKALLIPQGRAILKRFICFASFRLTD